MSQYTGTLLSTQSTADSGRLRSVILESIVSGKAGPPIGFGPTICSGVFTSLRRLFIAFLPLYLLCSHPLHGADDYEFALGLKEIGYRDLAAEQFRRMKANPALSVEGKARASLGLADLYMEGADSATFAKEKDEFSDKALAELDFFLKTYPQHRDIPQAKFRKGLVLENNAKRITREILETKDEGEAEKSRRRAAEIFQNCLKLLEESAKENRSAFVAAEKNSDLRPQKKLMARLKEATLRSELEVAACHYFFAKIYNNDQKKRDAHLKEGARIAKEFVEKNKGIAISLVAYNYLGLCNYHLKKYDEGADGFSGVLRYKPTSDTAKLRQSAYYHKVVCCVASKRYNEAIKTAANLFDEFTEIKGQLAQAVRLEKAKSYAALAAELKSANKPKEAASRYRRAIEDAQEVVKEGGPWARTANELVAKWEKESGVKVYSAAQMFAAANALFADKKYSGSIDLYEKVILEGNPKRDATIIEESWYKIGHAYSKLDRTFEAAVAFGELPRRHPDAKLAGYAAYNSSVFFGLLYDKDGKSVSKELARTEEHWYVQALELFVQKFPDHKEAPRAQIRLGDTDRADERYLGAAEYYGRIDRRSEYYEQASYLAGLCYWLEFLKTRAKLPEKAAQRASDPQTTRLWQTAVEKLFTFVRWAESEPAIDTEVASRRKQWSGRARVRLGTIYVDELVGKPQKALDAVTNFESAYPDEKELIAQSLFVAAKANAKLDRLAEAEKNLERLMKEHPNFEQSSAACRLLGNAYFEKSEQLKEEGKSTEANEAKSNAAEYLSLSVEAKKVPTFEDYTQVGVRLYKIERFKEAADLFQRAIQRFGGDRSKTDQIWDTKLRLSKCSIALGQWKDSLRLSLEIMKQFPEDANCRKDVALSYENLSQHDNALREWLKVAEAFKEASSDWFDAKYHLILNHCRKRNYDQAYKIFSVTSAFHPGLGGAEMKKRFMGLLEKEFPSKWKKKFKMFQRELKKHLGAGG